MRHAAAVLAVVLSAACSPEFSDRTYYCGPERLCPPDQACNDDDLTCDSPIVAERFTCTGPTIDEEPGVSQLGAIECGQVLLDSSVAGCMTAGDERDEFAFAFDRECTGEKPHLELSLRYAIAFAPLALELVDENDSVIATGEYCTPTVDFTGTDELCLEVPNLPQGSYRIRVSIAPDAPDCDGDCRYNRYTLVVRYPLS